MKTKKYQIVIVRRPAQRVKKGTHGNVKTPYVYDVRLEEDGPAFVTGAESYTEARRLADRLAAKGKLKVVELW